VLQVLSDPSHPDLQPNLRVAAAAITSTKHRDLPLWLQGGLLTHAVHILEEVRYLRLSPTDAARTCAAAAAVLNNIIHVALRDDLGTPLPPPFTLGSILGKVRCPVGLQRMIRCGMLTPAAREPFPPGYNIHTEHAGDYALHGSVSKGYRTPLRVCGCLLAVVAMAGGLLQHFKEALGTIRWTVGYELVDADVFRHLLEGAAEDFGSTPPCWLGPAVAVMSTRVAMSEHRHTGHAWRSDMSCIARCWMLHSMAHCCLAAAR
jgi:hypothetical protein